MNYGKAVEEVWVWRETLSKELEGMNPAQQIKHINDKADDAIKKYGIRVKTPASEKLNLPQRNTSSNVIA
jgi:hypothetical protein